VRFFLPIFLGWFFVQGLGAQNTINLGTAPVAPAGAGPAAGATPAASGGGANSPLLSALGINQANVDPGNEIVSWNGNNWNISNNRLFESQFEEYLNSPEANTLQVLAYKKTLSSIRDLLSPSKVGAKAVDEAFRQLTLASDLPPDANICKVIANQVYMTWLSQKDLNRSWSAAKTLEEERKTLEWNIRVKTQGTGLSTEARINKDGNMQARQSLEQAELLPYTKRLMEVESLIRKNDMGLSMGKEQARLDFQVMITQLFLQRRFEHVLLALDFYRALFDEGIGKVRLGEEAMNLFSRTTGGTPTLASLESSASEAIHKIETGVRAFEVMLANRQIQSASKRLGETFMLGQHLPVMQLLPLEKKQQVLAFVQKCKRLMSAVEVKDYAGAEVILDDFRVSATDFDGTKASAAVQTAKLGAEMHLARARNAAVAGDRAALEKELQSAAELWPTNPQLRELSSKIFAQADVAAQAIADFDRLMSQKNHRQIFEDKLRFIAAVSMHPEKQASLKKVLDDMTEIEITMQQAAEISRRGDNAGAWEATEIMARKFPDDAKLNQFRTDQTLKAANFVNLIQQAEKFEKDGQPACALTAYLEAQRIYPPSSFAKDGIIRITRQILPDAN